MTFEGINVEHSDWNSIPISVKGVWGASSDEDVLAVVLSARKSAIDGIRIDTTDAPSRIEVRGCPERPCPMVWARDEPDRSATILLTTVDRRWAQLAYQFGHELGHVICNSWTAAAGYPSGPSHWLEEGLVEAFAIYTLASMGTEWAEKPPYESWSSYGSSLTSYSASLLTKYDSQSNDAKFSSAPKAWLQRSGGKLAEAVTLTSDIQPVIPLIAQALIDDRSLVADMKALNRWPEHGALPLHQYLQRWAKSCREIGAPGGLPSLLADKLETSELT